MIELKDLCVCFGDKTVFSEFNARIPSEGIIALCGNSGSGKTTLIKLLAGLVSPSRGTVSGLEGKRVSVVFQEDRLIEHLSALENTAVVNPEGKAGMWLDSLGLKDEKETKVSDMSGGMKRRAAIARALNFGGDILLLDEPLKGMEDGLKATVIKTVKNVFPLTVITLHEAREAEIWGYDKIIYL